MLVKAKYADSRIRREKSKAKEKRSINAGGNEEGEDRKTNIRTNKSHWINHERSGEEANSQMDRQKNEQIDG